MKIKASLCFSFATLSFLILFSTCASADMAQGTETQITTDGSDQYAPAIHGDRIVWEDWRNREGGSSQNADIYMYDLSTSTETQITTNESRQDNPKIYENKIVWQDYRNGNETHENTDVYMYDLSVSTETQITSNESGQYWPAIYGNRIVWTDDRNGNSDIYMYDLSSSTETQLTTNEQDQMEHAIYGDKIVWQDYRNGNWDIYMYDLSISTEAQITTDGSDQIDPAIYGDKIVWQDYRNGYDNIDIYMYDLSTSTETQITPHESDQVFPSIYGNRIVWMGWNSDLDQSDIYMYDLSTSTETQITAIGSASYSAIYDNRIVWMDNRSGKSDIYMFTLAEQVLPVANFSTNVTEGYVPLTVNYTDLSENAEEWNWDFGDGNTSIEQNATHTYSSIGTYTVNLTVSNANGTDSKIGEIKVKEAPKKPVANFSASPTSGNVSLTVNFTDNSTGVPTSWKWSFGDGKSSTEKNPQHIYTKAGKYTVSLTVKNSFGKILQQN